MSLLDWFTGKNGQKKMDEKEAVVAATLSGEVQQQVITIDGRQVFVDLPYILPRDLQEANRLDFQHFMLRTILGANYLAPLDNPGSVLDVGCGTGRWMLEMAQTFPAASFVGTDILEHKSESSGEAPANVQFVQADILKGLAFPADYFDYVHQRFLFLGVPSISWPGVIRELVRVTRPGGWIELVETQLCMNNMGPALTQVLSWMVAASHKRGIDAWQIPNLEKEMQLAGLTDITYHRIDLPVGKWGGRIGSMMLTDGLGVADAMKPLVISLLGLSPAEFERQRVLLPEEHEVYRTEMPFFVAYGRRPL